ncbi:MAG: septation protein A [Gammaproteobacteria bacterium]|nr:septation protein A [Gammaproteobacteria bacterium]
MKFLFDLFPLLLFFAAFRLYDIYVATTVAIVASFAQVGFYWWRHRKFETMHLITLAVIVVFGGLTLIFHNDTFIKWKPTILYWVFAVLVLGSQLLRGKTVMERMLGGQLQLDARIWRHYNLSWGLFFVVAGALNIYVAFFHAPDQAADVRQATWVNFKVFGLLGLTFAFAVLQAVFLARHIQHPDSKEPR